jgi:hypothetical protein
MHEYRGIGEKSPETGMLFECTGRRGKLQERKGRSGC